MLAHQAFKSVHLCDWIGAPGNLAELALHVPAQDCICPVSISKFCVFKSGICGLHTEYIFKDFEDCTHYESQNTSECQELPTLSF